MRLCCVLREGRTFLLHDADEAPPIMELTDAEDNPSVGIIVLERLTGTTDPVDGIVMYEEVCRR
jgi:hypothetical protein